MSQKGESGSSGQSLSSVFLDERVYAVIAMIDWVSVGARVRRVSVLAAATLLAVGVAVGLCAAYGFLIEPHWIKVRRIDVSREPTLRVIHISDIHYKGEREYLAKVVATINSIGADIVCFTGDLVEDAGHLSECLEILSGIRRPLYGVPGNHDHLGLSHGQAVRQAFRKTGGDWLVETNVVAMVGALEIVGSSGRAARIPREGIREARKRLLLTHYPDTVGGVPAGAYDLMLSGHTHGGQVRIPLWDRPILRHTVLPYDKGLFRTAAGPLHVSPGIGTYMLGVRFGCRPEITVIGF